MNGEQIPTEITLLRDETLAHKAKEALGKIYNSGDLLLGIINDILDLSKIEEGKLELVPAKYEIASLINDTVSLNMLKKGNKPIEFQLLVDDNIPSNLIGDELRIKQILNNLLSNAFKYTDKGAVMRSVSTEKNNELKDDEIILIFTVKDTGQGMTEEQVEKLYDRFTRFISKPIDTRQLNAALKQFVRDKQTPNVIETARREAGQNGEEKTEQAENQGENALSAKAANLEKAAHDMDIAIIISETPNFLNGLREVIKRLSSKIITYSFQNSSMSAYFKQVN